MRHSEVSPALMGILGRRRHILIELRVLLGRLEVVALPSPFSQSRSDSTLEMRIIRVAMDGMCDP